MGSDVLIRCAVVGQWGPPDASDRINVQGTRRMVGASHQADARRFIHTGTNPPWPAAIYLRVVDEMAPRSEGTSQDARVTARNHQSWL